MNDQIQNLQQELHATLRKAARSRRRLAVMRAMTYGGALLYFIGIIVMQVLIYTGHSSAFTNDYNTNLHPTFWQANPMLMYIVPLFIVITVGGAGLSLYYKRFTDAEQTSIRRIIHEMFPGARLALLPSEVSNVFLRQSNFFGGVSNATGNTFGTVIFEEGGRKMTFRDMALNKDLNQSWLMKSQIGGMFVVFQMMFKGIFSSRMENITSSFRGMFANAQLGKKINGQVVVLPDHLESKLDYLAKNIQALKNVNGNKLVTLEDPEFERYFAVYASDEILARYVLTPAMMVRMTELKKKYNRDIMLSFNGDNFYFAVAMPEGFLTLGNASLTSGEALTDLYDNFVAAQGILTDLRLN